MAYDSCVVTYRVSILAVALCVGETAPDQPEGPSRAERLCERIDPQIARSFRECLRGIDFDGFPGPIAPHRAYVVSHTRDTCNDGNGDDGDVQRCLIALLDEELARRKESETHGRDQAEKPLASRSDGDRRGSAFNVAMVAPPLACLVAPGWSPSTRALCMMIMTARNAAAKTGYVQSRAGRDKQAITTNHDRPPPMIRNIRGKRVIWPWYPVVDGLAHELGHFFPVVENARRPATVSCTRDVQTIRNDQRRAWARNGIIFEGPKDGPLSWVVLDEVRAHPHLERATASFLDTIYEAWMCERTDFGVRREGASTFWDPMFVYVDRDGLGFAAHWLGTYDPAHGLQRK